MQWPDQWPEAMARSSGRKQRLGAMAGNWGREQCPEQLDASGKPSTWFPPGRFVELIIHVNIFASIKKFINNVSIRYGHQGLMGIEAKACLE